MMLYETASRLLYPVDLDVIQLYTLTLNPFVINSK